MKCIQYLACVHYTMLNVVFTFIVLNIQTAFEKHEGKEF